MRAVVHDRYGPPEVLRLDDVERPVAAEDGILIRVHASSVTRGDCGWRGAKPFISRFIGPLVGTGGFFRPRHRTLGGEFAGEVEAVGAAVSEFEVGDRVFGTSLFGANAEFVSMRAAGPVAHMPGGMSFEEAGAVSDGAILALGCLRKAGPLKGRKILVYGASGSIGTAGVQLARHFGAHVTAVCTTKNVELVRSLGAEEVIDYTQEDFTTNGETYDVIFDAVGKLSFVRCRGSLRDGGVYLPTDGFLNAFWLLWTRRFGDKKVLVQLPPRYRKEAVLFLKGLVEAGEYRAVIDRTYPLEDIVEATKYVETKQKTGNVVLTVNGDRPR
jgi:NADPH:quinone reductase-like Zn-dependent oxidoreductase